MYRKERAPTMCLLTFMVVTVRNDEDLKSNCHFLYFELWG